MYIQNLSIIYYFGIMPIGEGRIIYKMFVTI